MVAMRGVQLFRAGTYKVLDHKGKAWVKKRFGREHLDEMVANFKRYQSPGPDRQHKLAIVVGHVPGDVYDPTTPRHGSVNRVYRNGETLYYDCDDVDPKLAEQITKRRYDDLSAEIYDSPAEAGLDGNGLMLRRVAILGGDVPKIKGLNPEGLAKTLKFAEDEPGFAVFCSTFSEGEMGRDELMKVALEAGMEQDVLDTLDDVQLAAICKALQGAGEGEGGEGETPENPENSGADEAAGTSTETPAEAPTEDDGAGVAPGDDVSGEPAISEDRSKDEEGEPDIGEDKDASNKKFGEMCGAADKWKSAHKKKFGEDPRLDAAASSTMGTEAPSMSTTASFSEDQLKSIVEAAVKPVVEAINKEVAKETDATRAELRRQRVQMFCESESIAGRISPAEMDETAGPTLVDRLMKLDDVEKIHKFSENGRERELTALDAELRAIRQRPVKYRDQGKKIASGVAGTAKFSEAAETVKKERFLAFAETLSEELAKAGMTPAEMTDAWMDAQKRGDHKTVAELERDLGYTGAA